MDPTTLNDVWKDQFRRDQRLLVKYLGSSSASDEEKGCHISVIAPELVREFPIEPYETHIFPFYAQAGYQLVTSCKGLVCCDNKRGIIVVSNPTTKQLKFLPPPHRAKLRELDPKFDKLFDKFGSLRLYAATGFGFDSSAQDYKVVRILEYCFSCKAPGDCLSYFTGDDETVAEVYSLKEEAWRRIPCPNFVDSGISFDFYVYIDGTFHWLNKSIPSSKIISFDFASETFDTLELPTHSDLSPYCMYALLELESELVVSGFNMTEKVPDHLFVFWMQRERSSWQILFKIVLDNGLRPILLKPEVFFFETKSDKDNLYEVVAVVLPSMHLHRLESLEYTIQKQVKLGFFARRRCVKLVCYDASNEYLSNAQPMNETYTVEEGSSDDDDDR